MGLRGVRMGTVWTLSMGNKIIIISILRRICGPKRGENGEWLDIEHGK